MSRKYLTYTPVDPNIGVFQRNYYAFNNFASFKGSSYKSAEYSNETTVIELNNGKYYHSDLQDNANFTISFRFHRLKLSGFTLLSCSSGQCVYNIEVFGSNDNISWNYECSVSQSIDYFKGTPKYVDCKSNNFYKHYRLMHKGVGMNNQAYFPIRYLELFGDLYPNRGLFCLSKACNCRSKTDFFLYILLSNGKV